MFYQGETIKVSMAFKTNDDAPLDNVSELAISAAVYNTYGSGEVLYFAADELTVDNTNGVVSFEILPAQSAKLLKEVTVDFEIANDDGIIIHQQKGVFHVAQTKIKDF